MTLRGLAIWLLIAGALACPRAALAQLELDGELEGSLDGEAPPDEAALEPEPSDTSEASLDGEPPSADGALATAPAAEPSRALALHVAAGLGVGSLGYTRPTGRGVQRLPDSVFAAAELLLRLHAWPRAALSLEAQLAYQTSVGFGVELRPLFALPERIAARAQRVELSAGPRVALSSDRRGLALAVPVGAVLRSFFPEEHQYSVQAYNLGSAFVRPELIVPLGALITLRGGPEAHWIAVVEPSLEREGAAGPGYALGVQASLAAAVGETFSVALAFRELRSVIPTAARFEDTERFLTVRFGGSL